MVNNKSQLLNNLSQSEGLTEEEARKRLSIYGKNIYWKKLNFDWERFFKEVILNYFNIILIIALIISIFVEQKFAEAIIIFVFLLISIIVSFITERWFYHLTEKLQKYFSKKVLVRRDGENKFINAEDLVPGDLIYLIKGEKIPADCEIFKSYGLLVDESILTGESTPVFKKVGDKIYTGSELIEGEAEAIVISTGKQTRFGQIEKLSLTTEKNSSYQLELNKFSKQLLIIVSVFSLILFLAHIFNKTLTLGESLIFVMVLAVSILPEMLPSITALSLGIFSHRFIKRKVIIKRLSAIEDLGIIDILCVDKTGTITTNDLKLEKIESDDIEKFITLTLGALENISQKYLADFKKAIEAGIVDDLKIKVSKNLSKISLKNRSLFNPQKKVTLAVLKSDKNYILVVIGAPEVIINLSSNINRKKYLHKIEWYSENGFRTYAVGYREISNNDELILKTEINLDKINVGNLNFLGLAAFRDSLKPHIKNVIQKAKEFGINIKILTGDRPEVAKKVATEIGLISLNEKVYSEDELLKLNSEQFEKVVEEFKVFARLTPEMKYRLVEVLKKKYYVGYLGEGINDIPVLKLAHIGISVDTAVDAAKDVADIVLLNKDLGVIIDGIELGRQALRNNLKYLKHTMIDNFGNFFMIGFLSIIKNILPLTPLQILLTNVLTDLPLIGVSYDTNLTKELKVKQKYTSRDLFKLLIYLGAVSSLFNLIVFLLFIKQGTNILQTALFLQTTLSGLIIFYSIRTDFIFFKGSRPKLIMNLLMLLAFVLTIISFYPPLNKLFNFSTLDLHIIIFLIILNLIYFVISDLIKVFLIK